MLLGCRATREPAPLPTYYPVLSGRPMQAAKTIEFTGSRDGQPYRLEPGPLGVMRLVQPIRDTAAADALARLAKAFADASLEVPATDAPDPRSLEHPIAFLEATFPDGTVRIEFGAPASNREGLLVARVGNRVGMVPATLLGALQPEQARLRERALFERPASMDRLSIDWRAATGPQTCVAHRVGSIWRFEGPLPTVPVTAADLAESIGALRADDYRYGFTAVDPAATVRIEVSGPHGREEISLHRVDGGWVGTQAHRDLAVFVTMPPALRALLPQG